MSDPAQHHGTASRTGVVLLSAVIGVSCVGYLVGVFAGAPDFDSSPVGQSLVATDAEQGDVAASDSSLIPAVSYAEMRRRQTGPTSQWNPSLEQLLPRKFDLFAELKPSESEKQKSTLTRASRRAYNGAPPVIPHAIENTADAACYACHGQGMRIGDRVANQMSHAFLANCTQCHAPPPPKPFNHVDASVQSSFVGLPAPSQGERAFPSAPPTIPHSTWMRQTCLSCHGDSAGWAGLQSTHPWRINCQQCHAPSAKLDQAVVPSELGFLPAINVNAE